MTAFVNRLTLLYNLGSFLNATNNESATYIQIGQSLMVKLQKDYQIRRFVANMPLVASLIHLMITTCN